MGALNNLRNQAFTDHLFDASGTIATGGTAQLILPVAISRSSLVLENPSAQDMYVEFGGARATATLTSGAVSSCSVTNAGIGYSRPPSVKFYGGVNANRAATPTYSLQGLPDYPSPSNPAQAHCVMSGSAPNQTVGSIVIDNPGSGYAYPPFVLLENDPLDPYGAAAPSTTSGIRLLANGGSYTPNGSVCTTDQISIYCVSSSLSYVCKFTL